MQPYGLKAHVFRLLFFLVHARASGSPFSAAYYAQCPRMSPQHLVPQVARCLEGPRPSRSYPLREASSKTGHRGPREDLYTRASRPASSRGEVLRIFGASRPAGHLKRKQAQSPLREVTRVSRPEARSAMLHHSSCLGFIRIPTETSCGILRNPDILRNPAESCGILRNPAES
jgi:hypothetical protein